MTEWEKAKNGFLYDANFSKEVVGERTRCAELCYELNQCRPSEYEKQQELLKKIFGKIKGTPVVTAPFYCDYGFHISVGENFYTNHNVTILDGAEVTFGDNVYVGPNCVISTAGHALDAEQRNLGLEIALPITVGDSVWIGANAVILPGVAIGSNTVIGAGSVVNRDIPEGVIAAGNPCKVLRKITEADKKKYPVFEEMEETDLKLVRLERNCKDRAYFEAVNQEAFPDIERMSMNEIFTFAANTDGEVLGIYDGETPVGFTLFVKNDTCGYVFFFAIDGKLRSKGYGSAALRKLFERYQRLQIVLDFEELDPKAENYEQRVRRKQFYLRNGFYETGNYTFLRGERFEVVCNREVLNKEKFLELIHVIHANCPEFPALLV